MLNLLSRHRVLHCLATACMPSSPEPPPPSPRRVQNAGKSSLINAMRQAARLPKEKDVTTAPLPGTTLGEPRHRKTGCGSWRPDGGGCSGWCMRLYRLLPAAQDISSSAAGLLRCPPSAAPVCAARPCRHAARGRPAAHRLQDAGHARRAARTPGKCGAARPACDCNASALSLPWPAPLYWSRRAAGQLQACLAAQVGRALHHCPALIPSLGVSWRAT